MISLLLAVSLVVVLITVSALTALTTPPDPPLDQDDLEGWM